MKKMSLNATSLFPTTERTKKTLAFRVRAGAQRVVNAAENLISLGEGVSLTTREVEKFALVPFRGTPAY